jgi:hypothetical protein
VPIKNRDGAKAVLLQPMSTRNWIRIAVLTGLMAWPAVETYRYHVAVRQCEAALQLQTQVADRLVQVKRAHRALASRDAAVTPVSAPGGAAMPSPGRL